MLILGIGCLLVSFISFMVYNHIENKRLENTLAFLMQISNPKKLYFKEKEVEDMSPCGYWTGYSWMGLMPDGTWQPFVSEEEYNEALES